MLSRLLTLSAAVLASLVAYGAAVATGAWPVWVVAVAVGAVAGTRPPAGVLLVAAFAPLGGAIAALAGLRTSATEPLVLAALAGWLWRRVVTREPWDLATVTLAGLFALVVLASLLTQCALAYELLAPESVSFPRALLQWLTGTGGAFEGPLRPEVPSAFRLVGGLGLFVMTVEVCRRSPAAADGAVWFLMLGAAGVAALSANRFVEIVLRQGGDLLAAATALHRFVRISSTISDINAAGLMFALVLPAAAAQWLAPRRRFIGVVAFLFIGAGLWLTGSRAAMVGGAAGLMAYLTLLARRRWTRARVALTGSMICVALAALVFWYPRGAAHATTTDAWLIRKYLAITSVEMARTAPLSGVGIGRFQAESPRFAPAALFRYYEAQNAHNQVLQLLGELGLPGAGFFVALLACSVVPHWRRLTHPTSESIRAPVVFGLLGFMLASLLQHPLLVPEVSAAFWLALGLARSTVAVAPVKHAGRLLVSVVALVAVGLAVSIPLRSHSARDALNLEGVGIGLSPWRTDPVDGRRYRLATGDAVLYVDGQASRLRIAVRPQGSATGSGALTLLLDGHPAGRLSLEPSRWTEIVMVLPSPVRHAPRFRRLDLRWAGSTPFPALQISQNTLE